MCTVRGTADCGPKGRAGKSDGAYVTDRVSGVMWTLSKEATLYPTEKIRNCSDKFTSIRLQRSKRMACFNCFVHLGMTLTYNCAHSYTGCMQVTSEIRSVE